MHFVIDDGLSGSSDISLFLGFKTSDRFFIGYALTLINDFVRVFSVKSSLCYATVFYGAFYGLVGCDDCGFWDTSSSKTGVMVSVKLRRAPLFTLFDSDYSSLSAPIGTSVFTAVE